jgi:hypothetical protein
MCFVEDVVVWRTRLRVCVQVRVIDLSRYPHIYIAMDCAAEGARKTCGGEGRSVRSHEIQVLSCCLGRRLLVNPKWVSANLNHVAMYPDPCTGTLVQMTKK